MENLEQEPIVNDQISDETEVEYEVPPPVILKNDLDVGALRSGHGAEFEVQDTSDDYQVDFFDRENIYKEMNIGDTCGGDDESSDEEDRTPFEKLARKMQDVLQDGSGCIMKKIVRPGAGEVLPPNCYVTVHYNGYLEYADEPFDSTRLRNRPMGFRLGKGEVIPGFDIGIATMKKGEEAQFLIKSDYGYRDQGCPPRIPGKADLLFVVEVLNFVDKEGVDEYYSMTSEEKRNASWDVISKVVRDAKDRGKELFQRSNYGQAKNCYLQAARFLEDHRLQNSEEEVKWKEACLRVYLNLAVCCSKLSDPNGCLRFARRALETDKNNVKALYLMGKSHNQKRDFKKARSYLDRARKLKHNSPEINEEIDRLNENIEKHKVFERDMCQRMFAQASHDTLLSSGGERVNPPVESVTRQPTTTQECSPEFKVLVKEKLEKFVADDSLATMPVEADSYTSAEIACIVETADDMGLRFDRKVEGSCVILVIRKAE